MMSYQPKLSIIIAVKNARAHLLETLSSIAAQDYPNLEVIVCDGASTDGSVEELKKHPAVSRYISEPDQGISDAFNKGLQLVTGDYINFQGAGDLLHEPQALSRLFFHCDESYELICGQVLRVKEDGVTAVWVAPKKIKPFKARSLLYKMSLPHQGLFTHRRFFERFGGFDVQTRFAMDYELLLRAYHQFPKTIIKEGIVSRWREGGVGQHRIMEVLNEYHRIKSKHQIEPTLILNGVHALNQLKYHVKTKILKQDY